MHAPLATRPRLGFGGLVNLSFGFLGIQVGFALQNANMSRIFQSLGESIDNLPALWIAAPVTGLLIQPVIGHYSDRTWTRLGRRRPYFLAGAVFAALALFIMPLTPGALSLALLSAAVLLWVLDASLNVAMEPFRAFVGDTLHTDQHTAGYAVQTMLIGVGAVMGSIIPWVLDHLGVSNVAPPGGIPDTVKLSFWIGGAALLAAVTWTVVRTREFSPAEMAAFDGRADPSPVHLPPAPPPAGVWPLAFIGAGGLLALLVYELGFEQEVYVLAGLLAAWGVASLVARRLAAGGRADTVLGHIVGDFAGMPSIMKRLALAQFFAWSALFTMWIYTTPVVARYVFGATDTASAAYNEGGNWVGVLFAAYNAVAAVAALLILPRLSARIGKARTHMVCLLAGAAGFTGFLLLRDPKLLLLAEIGIGIAWASILAMPYAILASSLPQRKLGIYMGLFNVFVVVPQLLVATVMGSITKHFFPGEPIYTMAFAAATMLVAAAAMLRVQAD